MKYILACLLIFSLACKSNQSSGVAIADSFRFALSPDTQSLIFVKLDKLKASDLYHRHQQDFEIPQINEIAQRLGLDPRRDLSEVLIAWDGKHPLVLAQGSFSNQTLEQKLTAGGATRATYKNFTIYERSSDAVCFPAAGLAMASQTTELHAALDRFSSHAGTIPEELQQRLAETPPDSQIAVVSRGGLPTGNFPIRADINSALSNITSYVTGTSMGVRLDSGSHLKLQVVCNTPEGAQRVNDATRGLIGLARLSTNDSELDLLRMWDAVSVTKDDRFVRIQADLAADLTEKLITQVQKMRGRASTLPNMQ